MVKLTLKNNTTLLHDKKEDAHTINITLTALGGLLAEDNENNGISTLLCNTLVKSGNFLYEAERYGANVSFNASTDMVSFTFNVASEFQDKIVDELKQFLTDLPLEEDVFRLEKDLLLSDIEVAEDSPRYKFTKRFSQVSYPNFIHYALTTSGQKQSVQNVTFTDIKVLHSKLFNGSNIVAAIVGNYNDKFLDALKSALDSLPNGLHFNLPQKANDTIIKSTWEEMQDKRITQASMQIAYNAPNAVDNDYDNIKIGLAILATGMSSPYFRVLRKENGYAYSVGAFSSAKIFKSRIISHIGLDYANVQKAFEDIQKLNTDYINKLTEKEIEIGKNKVLGSIQQTMQSNDKLAWLFCFYETIGLGTDYIEKYKTKIETFTEKDLDALKAYFNQPYAVLIQKP